MLIDRILKIIELEGINKSQFYKKTGLSNGFLDKVKDVGVSKIEDILKSYPKINPEWLLTGKGNMLRSSESKKVESSSEDVLKDKIISLLEAENERLKSELSKVKSDKSESIKTSGKLY